MTTNESGKWDALGEAIGEGRVWRAELAELGVGRGGWECEAWPLKPKWVVLRMEEAGMRPGIWRGRRGVGDVGEGGGGKERGSGEEGNRLEHEHEHDGEGDDDGWEEDPRWMPVRGLAEVDNIYDLGFWGNVADLWRNREVKLRREG
jgi:hypothetical protein